VIAAPFWSSPAPAPKRYDAKQTPWQGLGAFGDARASLNDFWRGDHQVEKQCRTKFGLSDFLSTLAARSDGAWR
jgi:hypothetical protein